MKNSKKIRKELASILRLYNRDEDVDFIFKIVLEEEKRIKLARELVCELIELERGNKDITISKKSIQREIDEIKNELVNLLGFYIDNPTAEQVRTSIEHRIESTKESKKLYERLLILEEQLSNVRNY